MMLPGGSDITRDELLRYLRGIAQKQREGAHDLETHHIDADDALLAFINDPEIRQAYEEIEKWHA